MAPKSAGRRLPRWALPLLMGLLFLAYLGWACFRAVVADWNDVPSSSMKPTILDGDRVFVDKAAYDLRVPFSRARIARWSEPQRGDIVLFFSPDDHKRLLKRVMGAPGDRLEMREGSLSLNGQPLGYQLLEASEMRAIREVDGDQYQIWREQLGEHRHLVMMPRVLGRPGDFAATTVPAGKYFVLGDNRWNSRDSRYFGFVDRSAIVGRVTLVVWSLAGSGKPRAGRWFLPVE